MLVLYPIIVVLISTKGLANMKDLEKKFGPLYEDIKTEDGPWQLIYPLYFLLRRFVLAALVVLMQTLLIF